MVKRERFDYMNQKELFIFIFAIIAIVIILMNISKGWQKDCEAKGGEYHYQYKSQPLCLKKGSTINLN